MGKGKYALVGLGGVAAGFAVALGVREVQRLGREADEAIRDAFDYSGNGHGIVYHGVLPEHAMAAIEADSMRIRAAIGAGLDAELFNGTYGLPLPSHGGQEARGRRTGTLVIPEGYDPEHMFI